MSRADKERHMSRTDAHTPYWVKVSKADDQEIVHHRCPEDIQYHHSIRECDAEFIGAKRPSNCTIYSDQAFLETYIIGGSGERRRNNNRRRLYYGPERAHLRGWSSKAVKQYRAGFDPDDEDLISLRTPRLSGWWT